MKFEDVFSDEKLAESLKVAAAGLASPIPIKSAPPIIIAEPSEEEIPLVWDEDEEDPPLFVEIPPKPVNKTGLKWICAKEDVKLTAYNADGKEKKFLFRKQQWWRVDVTTNFGDAFDMIIDETESQYICMNVPFSLFMIDAKNPGTRID